MKAQLFHILSFLNETKVYEIIGVKYTKAQEKREVESAKRLNETHGTASWLSNLREHFINMHTVTMRVVCRFIEKEEKKQRERKRI